MWYISFLPVDYESALFHFNTVTRVQYYAHEVTNVEGLDHCYDCMAELYIIRQYIRKLGVPHCVQQYLHTLLRDDKDLSHIEENELIGHFSSFITSQLSPFGKRSLKLMWVRRNGFSWLAFMFGFRTSLWRARWNFTHTERRKKDLLITRRRKEHRFVDCDHRMSFIKFMN